MNRSVQSIRQLQLPAGISGNRHLTRLSVWPQLPITEVVKTFALERLCRLWKSQFLQNYYIYHTTPCEKCQVAPQNFYVWDFIDDGLFQVGLQILSVSITVCSK